MIYVLFGENPISIAEKVDGLRDRVQPKELSQANILSLDGKTVKLDELLSAVMAAPFLTNRRLVIVRNLLTRFESRKSRSMAEWKGVSDRLSAMPETSDLLFVDGPLTVKTNWLLKDLSENGKVKSFPLPKGAALHDWIRARLLVKEGFATDQAVSSLAEAVGTDLLLLESELEKLVLYAADRPIEPRDVESMVSKIRESNIFAAVDAAIGGRSAFALTQFRQVQSNGQSAAYILHMLHRQVRLLMLAKELQIQNVKNSDMSSRLGVKGYPLQKTLEQAPRFTVERLATMHGLLVQTDERIKSGRMRDAVALDLLIADLGALIH